MLLSERHRYGATLALIAVAILVLGYLLRPAPARLAKRADDLRVTRAEIENLQQLVRRNNLRNLSSNFVTTAEDAVAHIGLIHPWATNAVLTPDLGLIVPKSLDALPRQLSTAIGTLQQPIVTSGWVPGLPFVIGRTQLDAEVTRARIATGAPAQGGWVLVVGRGSFGQMLINPGIFDGLISAPCGPFIQNRFQTTIPLNQTHIGGGLFDLAGDLHGVVVPCDDAPAIIPITEIRRALASVSSNAAVVLARHGIRFANEPGSPKTTVVSEIWDNWPADEAGVQPGDQVISVDGQPVSIPEDAVAILFRNANIEHDLRLRRERRNITAHVNAMTVQGAASVRPALYPDASEGVTVARVPRGSSADAAGIVPGDRVLSIDGKASNRTLIAEAFGQFRVAESVSLVVSRPGRRLFVVVQP
jgi:S1-C subfamily serine protease